MLGRNDYRGRSISKPYTAPALPSFKQVKFLDGLAGTLGYPSGKAFVRDLYGVDQYGVIRWTRASVYQATQEALRRRDARRRAAAKTDVSRGTVKPGSA